MGDLGLNVRHFAYILGAGDLKKGLGRAACCQPNYLSLQQMPRHSLYDSSVHSWVTKRLPDAKLPDRYSSAAVFGWHYFLKLGQISLCQFRAFLGGG